MKDFLAVLVVAMLAGCQGGNLLEEIEKANATTLLSLLQSVGLDKTLVTGYYTLFVPTNEAFAALPGELTTLLTANDTVKTQVLEYHAVNLIFRTVDAVNNMQLLATSGQNVRINVYWQNDSAPAVVTAEGRRLVGPDIVASNGYIHLVDRVLLPPSGDLYQMINMSQDLSKFKALIDAAGLQSQLTDHEGTLLVPTNDAFKEMEAAVGTQKMEEIEANHVVLREILLYHMLEDVIYGPGAFNGTYRSKDIATQLEVSTGADGVTYINNQAKVVVGDIAATNGVVHVLDKVLMPPKYVISLIGK